MTTQEEFKDMAEFILHNFDISPRDSQTPVEYMKSQALLGVYLAFEHLAFEHAGERK